MKVSLDWLKEYAKVNLNAEQIGEILTDTGLEVEKIEDVEKVPGGLKGVVVGHVEKKWQHPNADRLNLTLVNIGEAEPLQIVCGAPNVAEGQKVMVSTVGATLHPTGGEPFKIKKGKIRGEVSLGMLCSEVELGLGESADGIMVLDSEAKPGTPASDFLNLTSDKSIEIGLTPNRTDAMGHIGVARDLLVGVKHHDKYGDLHSPLTLPESNLAETGKNDSFAVNIEDSADCPRYMGAVIKGVSIQPSPTFIQDRLRTIGLEPINNVVDITNYVLHEFGHPLHAFDLSEIAGNEVKVIRAKEGQKFTTLDDKERELSAHDIIIADAQREPLCLAGVFGGNQSGVSNKTTDLFLECAVFNPISVRKTAKRHQLNTDASFRFERGVDADQCHTVISRAIQLVLEHAGGQLEGKVIDEYPAPSQPEAISFSPQRCNRVIGLDIPTSKLEEILVDLDFSIEKKSDEEWICTAPKYRVDVTREADVIEEILRIYGYNRIPLPEKLNASLSSFNSQKAEGLTQQISETLSANGFNEVMNNSLIMKAHNEICDQTIEGNPVQLLNPLSTELEELRTSLSFTMLQTAAFNLNRKSNDLRLYEFGKVYAKGENGYHEKQVLGLLLTGKTTSENWLDGAGKVQMPHLIQGFKKVFNAVGIDYSLKQDGDTLVFQYRKKDIGTARKATKKELKHFGIKQEVILGSIFWDEVLAIQKAPIKYETVSKFPAVQRDLSLLLDENVKYIQLEKEAKNLAGKLLKDTVLFDVYEGDKLPKGKKSYAIRFTLGDDTKTLKDATIEKTMSRILDGYKSKFGVELR